MLCESDKTKHILCCNFTFGHCVLTNAITSAVESGRTVATLLLAIVCLLIKTQNSVSCGPRSQHAQNFSIHSLLHQPFPFICHFLVEFDILTDSTHATCNMNLYPLLRAFTKISLCSMVIITREQHPMKMQWFVVKYCTHEISWTLPMKI